MGCSSWPCRYGPGYANITFYGVFKDDAFLSMIKRGIYRK
jgi:hypothetical protein